MLQKFYRKNRIGEGSERMFKKDNHVTKQSALIYDLVQFQKQSYEQC